METIRLYKDEGLSIINIAKIQGITKQGVFDRLKRYGVDTKTPGRRKRVFLDRERLVDLYLRQQMLLSKISGLLNVSQSTVLKEFIRHGIERRRWRSRKEFSTPLERLEIGRSVMIPKDIYKSPHTSLFKLAKARGIKLSLKSDGRGSIKITRIS